APAQNALLHFNLNSFTGQLTLAASFVDGVGGVDGLQSVSDVAISSDGKFVYTASPAESKLSLFTRNTTTGALTFSQVVFNCGSPPRMVAVLPSYAAGTSAVIFGSQFLQFATRDPHTGLLSNPFFNASFGVPTAMATVPNSTTSAAVVFGFDNNSVREFR